MAFARLSRLSVPVYHEHASAPLLYILDTVVLFQLAAGVLPIYRALDQMLDGLDDVLDRSDQLSR